MEGRRGEGPLLPSPLLAKCPHGLPSGSYGWERDSPCPANTPSLPCDPQGSPTLHEGLSFRHHAECMGVGGARPYGWVSKSLWLYSFPLLILESPPCATPIQGEIIPGCNGGLKGKRLCYSSQPLRGPLEHPLCFPAAWASIVIRWSMWSPPPGLG